MLARPAKKLQFSACGTQNPLLVGRLPTGTIAPVSGRSSGVEHNLAKVGVGRSNRLARSIFPIFVIPAAERPCRQRAL